MAVTQLTEKRVAKVWGRRDLPHMFEPAGEEAAIGEIWFEHPCGADFELLVKYLFTSDKLSIQVHPDDEQARRSGHDRGKDEAWVLLDAEPGAVIGLGLTQHISSEELRAAALDGSIESLLDWRPAAAGDFYYSPAGTVHALGAGLTLVEIQQNAELTYRLYDYGRPRELHLDRAVAAADAKPYVTPTAPVVRPDGRQILARGGQFVVERWTEAKSVTLDAADSPVWLIPLAGDSEADGQRLAPGTVWVAQGTIEVRSGPGADLLVAYPGGSVREPLTD